MDLNTQAAAVVVANERPAMAELELENGRLQRLVADLLIKNQQLRVELKAAQRTPARAVNLQGISNN